MRRIVAYVPDLMDKSRFGPFSHETTFVRSPADVVEAVSQPGVEIVVLDLGRDGVAELLPQLESHRVLAFSSHVNKDAMKVAAMSSSADVLARSVFFNRISSLLSQ